MSLQLSDYDYLLPKDLIAQKPVEPRDSCRLLVINPENGAIEHRRFRDLMEILTPQDCLVLNNTRVMPARLFGKKPTGGNVELLLLHETDTNIWECLVRPGRRLEPGTRVNVNCHSEGTIHGIEAEILRRGENGTRLVKFFSRENLNFNIRHRLPQIGKIPFPPYVKEPPLNDEEYQTVFSKVEGSVAAPTAGLHFTPSLLQALAAKSVTIAEITLHVGWGTFKLIQSETIENHRMDKEWYSISSEAAEIINTAQSQNKRIVAVGSTACRVLESLPAGPIQTATGWTNLFIYPGFRFKRTQALLTNFHLPRSTLFLLACAFANKEKMLNAYREAVKNQYRFYSFGDAMFIKNHCMQHTGQA